MLDASAGQATVRLRAPAPAGGGCGSGQCWKPHKGSFVYRNPGGADGLVRLLLKPGEKGAIEATGAGEKLDFTLPMTPPLTARLQRADGGVCWESVLSTVPRNDQRRLKAR